MQYNLAFRYFVDRKGSFVNMLLLIACGFIPIVGPIVQLGYRAETLDKLIRDPDLRKHSKFNFDRFMEYLTRGIWPFLYQLILGFGLLFVLMVAVILTMLIFFQGNLPVVGFILLGVVYILWVFLVIYVSWPVSIYAEIMRKFDISDCWRFTRDFWKHLGFQAAISIFLYAIISTFVAFLGLLLCFIGIYPAAVICQMAGVHFQAQHYVLYLDAGGEPLIYEEEEDDEEYYEDESDEFEDDDVDDRRTPHDR